jgi:hypothetical protein
MAGVNNGFIGIVAVKKIVRSFHCGFDLEKPLKNSIFRRTTIHMVAL